MIPIDFGYYRPESLQEAADIHKNLFDGGQSPVFYAGGSEIITMARAGSISPGAVIDIKSISECNVLELQKDTLLLGAANSLYRIKESKQFPLLGTACGRIADHTNQCRITLGGNLCGTIRYRETSLPLMLCDAKLMLYSPAGMRTVKFEEVFDGSMHLQEGEFIVQVHIPAWATKAQYMHIKKTANEKIDYPLVNVTALIHDDFLCVAFTGVCAYPFRSTTMEQALNDISRSIPERVEAALAVLPESACTDAEASGAYRLFVLRNTLSNLLEESSHAAV